MNAPDPFNLQRFLDAQAENYAEALRELEQGRKRTHWIWYVFPQVAGLGRSAMAEAYAIQSREEAVAYLQHPVLVRRLHQCCEALLKHRDRKIQDIMGFPDDLKLRSSLTLFAVVGPDDRIFQQLLNTFYSGQRDDRTIAFLNPA